MSIKYWTPRHRTTLYNIFDDVRLYNYAVVDSDFIGDMLAQKITEKAIRRIENEWRVYWNEVFEEEPATTSKLLVNRINQHQFLFLKAGKAKKISNLVRDKYEDLFKAKIEEEDEYDDED